MTSYPAPSQNIDFFNPAFFTQDETPLTIGEANKIYFKKSGRIVSGSVSRPVCQWYIETSFFVKCGTIYFRQETEDNQNHILFRNKHNNNSRHLKSRFNAHCW